MVISRVGLVRVISTDLIKHAQRESDRLKQVLHTMTSDCGRDDGSGDGVIDIGQPEEASPGVQREPHADLRHLLVFQSHEEGGG